MIRQRALAWAVVLALVATVQIAPVPTRFSAPVGTALAQDAPAAGSGEPTDLAVAALHCTEAPAAEALSTFLATGTPPAGCAPAVGVVVAVEEDGSALPGSPFATDVTGTLAVPVGLGSAVTANEDVKSLPPGYEPLTQEANGVPYANPVKLDSATAGAAVLFVNVPAPVAAALAQAEDTSNANAEEPVDLAVLALHCADAPAEDALAALFATGTPPTGCAPAVGVAVAVEEDNEQLSGSPFRTDVDGTLAIRIGVGSEVTVKEDPKSLPSGYVPLTQEANGVPYANPVQLDSAVAGAAVLFVSVPSSVAAKLGQGTSTVDAGDANQLAHAITRDRTACDPAYPDERTCITPGLPLAEPCSITDQRNFTVLSPDPRGLDTNGNGIGCEPISPNGGTVNHGGGFNLYTSSTNLRRAYPARTGDLAVAASHVDSGDGVWVLPPQGSRADTWFVHRDRNSAGLWSVAPGRNSTSNLAVVSNPVFIGNGHWTWPNRHDKEDWFWRSRNHAGIRFWPSSIRVGNLTIAASGSGNVAVASNPIVISNGVWVWPNGSHSDAWRWRNHISVSNLTIARSGTGNLAIVSNPIVISHGLWFVSPDHSHKDDWILRGDRSRTDDRPVDAGSVGADVSDVELLTINGGLVEPSPAASIEPSSESSGQPPADSVQPSGDGKIAALTINDGPAVEPSVDGSLELPSNTGGGLPTDANAGPPSDVIVAPPADAAGSPDSAAPDAGYVDPGVDAGYPAQQSVDPGYVAPDPGYAEPAVDPSIDPGYVAPDPGYVASDPGYTPPEPNYVDPGYVDPGIAAPGPSNEVPDPVYIAPEPNYKQPEQVYTQEPTSIDPGTLAQDSGMNLGNVAPDPGNYVDPNAGFGNVDLGIDPGYVDPGNGGADSNYVAPGPGAGPANVAPDPSFDAGVGPSNVDLGGDPGGNSGNIAPNPDAGLGEQDRGGDNG
jgi:hypothetical protein